MFNDLKTFKISNGALKSEALPSRLKVFGWGENQTADGVFRAGDRTASVLSANQSKGFQRVAIDFDHCSVPGTETNKQLMAAGQPPLIFGYGDVVPKVGDGIYLENIVWTPLGIQHAKNFEDISPALRDENREVTFIHSVALTPNGKVNGLQFFSANENNTMKPEDYISTSELATAVGLKSDSPKKDVLAAIGRLSLFSALIVDKDGAITTFANCGIKDGKMLVLGDVQALSSRVQKIEEAGANKVVLLSASINGETKNFTGEDLVKVLSTVQGLEKKLADRESAELDSARENIIKLFSAEGKVPKRADGANYSAEELKKLDVPTLRLLHANTPVTVPLSARNQIGQTDGAKSFKDSKGRVDLAALFDEQNARNGVTATPNI